MVKVTLGLIVGNRGFFPDHLCKTGRETILKLLKNEDINTVALSLEDTNHGSVESLKDAHKCAELFKEHREQI
ncbi:MAG: fucose isomerase, partial [Candidatus Neomarinimicrobiota bacterium]